MRMRRIGIGLLLSVLCVAGLSACGDASNGSGGGKSASHNHNPVVFVLNTLKISGSDLLTPYAAGADAAAKQINARGGFGGRRVVIRTCNTMGQPSTTTTCAHTTVADHPVAAFGCELTWGVAALPLLAKAQIPSIMCLNSSQDFTNPSSFGLAASSFGEDRGMARYLCSRSSVRRVAVLTVGLPQLRDVALQAIGPVLQGCGKQTRYVYYPLNTTDLSPFVAKVLQGKPDFVMTFPLSGAQTPELFKDFEQSGFSASKMSAASSSFGYTETLRPAGAAMDGAYGTFEYENWGNTADPQVATYLRAMRGSGVDPRNSNVEGGYQAIMALHAIAKRIGFGHFNSASLTSFLRSKTGVPIPLSRTLVNPGPSGHPQVKQPYVQIVRWEHGRLVTVDRGTDHGWVRGY